MCLIQVLHHVIAVVVIKDLIKHAPEGNLTVQQKVEALEVGVYLQAKLLEGVHLDLMLQPKGIHDRSIDDPGKRVLQLHHACHGPVLDPSPFLGPGASGEGDWSLLGGRQS